MAWIKTKSGISAPNFLDLNKENMEEQILEIEKYHDRLICTSLDDIDETEDDYEELKANILRYQTHLCKFTCRKKKKTMTIKETEGHGKNDRRCLGK